MINKLIKDNKELSFIKDLDFKDIDLGDSYFLHVNNIDSAYVVVSGSAQLFYWSFNDGLATSNRKYIASFSVGDLLLGLNDYCEDKNTCGMYLILDHDTKLIELNCNHLFATKSNIVASKVNNYLSKISTIFSTDNNNYNFCFVDFTNGGEYLCQENSHILANDDNEILWLKAKQDSAKTALEEYLDKTNFYLISKYIYVYSPTEQKFQVKSTLDLIKDNNIQSAILLFNDLIQKFAYKNLLINDNARKENFSYLQNIQKSHLNSTFNKLSKAYYANKYLVPETTVYQEELPINRIILQLCRIFDIELKENFFKVIEQLDFCKKSDLEKALNIYKIYTRGVTLEPNWHNKERWILLSKLKDTNKSILLIHSKKNYHYYDASEDVYVKVTKDNVDNIENNALMLYRPMPEKSFKSGFDIIKMGLSFSKYDFAVIVITGIIIGLVQLVTPIITGKVISTALPSNDIGVINGYLLAIFSSAIGIATFQLVNSISMIRLEGRSALDIHSSLWARLLNLPMKFFNKFSTGDLADRANIIDVIHSTWSAATTSAVLSIFSMITTLGLLFYYNVPLAFISLFLFVLSIGIVIIFVSRNNILLAELYNKKGVISNLVFQLLSSIHKFRIASKENTVLSLWANLYNKISVNNRRYMVDNAIMQSCFKLLPLLSSIAIFAFIYYHLESDDIINLGNFISFHAAFGQLIGVLISISAILSSVFMTKPMIARLMPILEEEPEPSSNKIILDNLKGNIKIRNAFFRYSQNSPLILKNLSMTIKEGEYVAIVGSSGSGKSTILRLLMGFERLQSGSLFVDDINIQDIQISSLRNKIGTVLQNASIIVGSIFENIAAGNSDITEDDVWNVLEKSGIKDDVKEMPMGLHTIITENGSTLSGGQVQRLIIARALINNPAVLCLDEATSAMDNVVQRLVQSTLDNMNITRIVIAHRLSTIKNVDSIYVLDDGQIVEHGSYDELMHRKGHFFDLVSRQK